MTRCEMDVRPGGRRLVGLLGFEPRTKGFTWTGRFPFRVDYLFTLGS
jgi:hypothetical protein